MKTLLLASLFAAPMFPSVAFAQDLDDLDEDPDNDRGSKRNKKQKKAAVRERVEAEIIREVERGYYMKANIGATAYFINFASALRAGTALSLGFGGDIVDRERSSAAWEVGLYQGVHNGIHYEELGSALAAGQAGPQNLIQGDTRTFAAQASFEYSVYPWRRLGIGLRAGGGVMIAPLLMVREKFETEVCLGEWNLSVCPTVHSSPHPFVLAGPTFEYYTKLSHFSVGADVDFMYAIGWDLGMSATGYLKYTF